MTAEQAVEALEAEALQLRARRDAVTERLNQVTDQALMGRRMLALLAETPKAEVGDGADDS